MAANASNRPIITGSWLDFHHPNFRKATTERHDSPFQRPGLGQVRVWPPRHDTLALSVALRGPFICPVISPAGGICSVKIPSRLCSLPPIAMA